MKRSKLPFMKMDTMTGRYFTVHSQKPERVVKGLRKRFRDMRFTPQIGTFKVLAMYRDSGKEVDDKRAGEIENFIEKTQEV
jgi:hypothetical protein